MTMTVWVDSWQYQCCGDPFRVGSRVSWSLMPPDREWLADVLGAETAAGIDAAEERHDPDDAVPETEGTVTGISAAFCAYAPRPDREPNTNYPVPGTGVLAAVAEANPWTPDREDGGQFVGFVVRMEVDPGAGSADVRR